MGVCDTGVAYAETFKDDFLVAVSLARRRLREGERFNLGRFIGGSLFLP